MKGDVVSYIDHILVTEQHSSFVTDCSICKDVQECMSDHLAVCIRLVIPYKFVGTDYIVCESAWPKPNWGDSYFIKEYNNALNCKFSCSLLDIPDFSTKTPSEIINLVDLYHTKL